MLIALSGTAATTNIPCSSVRPPSQSNTSSSANEIVLATSGAPKGKQKLGEFLLIQIIIQFLFSFSFGVVVL